MNQLSYSGFQKNYTYSLQGYQATLSYKNNILNIIIDNH